MTIPERDRKAVLIGAAVLLGAAAMRLGILPLATDVQDARADLARESHLLQREEAQLRSARSLPISVEAATARVLGGVPRLLSGESRTSSQAWLVRRVGEAAQLAGARIARTEVLPPEVSEALTMVSMRIEGEGSFSGLGTLLATLEGDPVLLRVGALEIDQRSAAGVPGPEVLSFRFTVSGFVMEGGGSPPAQEAHP